jgi:hypothetical protein
MVRASLDGSARSRGTAVGAKVRNSLLMATMELRRPPDLLSLLAASQVDFWVFTWLSSEAVSL